MDTLKLCHAREFKRNSLRVAYKSAIDGIIIYTYECVRTCVCIKIKHILKRRLIIGRYDFDNLKHSRSSKTRTYYIVSVIIRCNFKDRDRAMNPTRIYTDVFVQ